MVGNARNRWAMVVIAAAKGEDAASSTKTRLSETVTRAAPLINAVRNRET